MEIKHGNRTLRFRIEAENDVLVVEDDIHPESWSEIIALDAQALLTALLNASVLTDISPATAADDRCSFCTGADNRAALAQALRSGQYQEQPVPWEGNHLRDAENRYSVTGVAATAVSPCVWAQLEGQWHTIWLDELLHALLERRNYGTEITDLTSEEEQALIRMGGGESRACPEITAQQVGLDTECTFLLHLNIAAVPAASHEALGIPPSAQGDRPLDRMSFENAAKVLTEFPNALGACTCR